MARRVAGRTRRASLFLKSVRIFSKTFTILEIEAELGANVGILVDTETSEFYCLF